MKICALSTQNNLDLKIELMYYLLPELIETEEMLITYTYIVMKVF